LALSLHYCSALIAASAIAASTSPYQIPRQLSAAHRSIHRRPPTPAPYRDERVAWAGSAVPIAGSAALPALRVHPRSVPPPGRRSRVRLGYRLLEPAAWPY